MKAIANIDISKYKSTTEQLYANICEALIEDEFGKSVFVTHYEPVSFNIPGGRYTPDFMHILDTGVVVFVEVKGSKKQRGYRDARAKLRATSEVYSYFVFVEVRIKTSRGEISNIEIEVIK